MSFTGRRLKIRCFLEGIEIPIISASVSSAPNSPSVASLQVLPLAEGTKLAARTLVHLFVFDADDDYNPLLNLKCTSSYCKSFGNWGMVTLNEPV